MIADLKNKKISVLGCGNMGGAILRGLCQADNTTYGEVVACDSNETLSTAIAKELAISSTTDCLEACASADVVIVALKPYVVPEVIASVSNIVSKDVIVVSVAAGVQVVELENLLPPKTHVVRVMPNLPCTIGEGVCGVFASNSDDYGIVEQIFSPIGKVISLDNEAAIDVITGLSGSGPAFVFSVIEGLVSGGVKMGLSKEQAHAAAVQTVLGSAKLVLESGISPEELRARVATPGGTTEAGLREIDKGSLQETLIAAVEAATKRANEKLSKS